VSGDSTRVVIPVDEQRVREIVAEATREPLLLLAESIKEIIENVCDADDVRRIMGEESPVSGWQPIETAPRDGTRMLISYSGCVWSGHWRDQATARGGYERSLPSGFTRDGFCDCPSPQPDCWQPLPEPPSPAERSPSLSGDPGPVTAYHATGPVESEGPRT